MKKSYRSRFLDEAIPDTSEPILKKADKLELEGANIVRMDMGKPDFDSPEVAKKAAIEALENGESHYTELNGTLRLRKAVAAKEKRDKGLDLDPGKNIIVTVGASEALWSIYTTYLAAGDEVLVPSPGYCSYFYNMAAFGIKPVEVPIIKDCEVVVDINAFKEKMSEHTKMILLNYPQNPTGLVYTEEQLTDLADFAKEEDLLVVSDECYEKYMFEGEFTSIATLPDMMERTFIVNSVSKSYGMTGWRVGYVAADEQFCHEMFAVHGNLILCAPSFAQAGAAAAFESETEEQMNSMKEKFRMRRNCILATLDEAEELKYVHPQGAFYIFVNVGGTGLSGNQFAHRFLDEYHVTCMPGEIYGTGYENYVRFAYTSSYEDTVEAMERLKSFLVKLRSEA